jgi:hypothetical protein
MSADGRDSVLSDIKAYLGTNVADGSGLRTLLKRLSRETLLTISSTPSQRLLLFGFLNAS